MAKKLRVHSEKRLGSPDRETCVFLRELHLLRIRCWWQTGLSDLELQSLDILHHVSDTCLHGMGR